MKRFLMGTKGFTLVELMVVVAIIGILSAVAIPNFKAYQAKSKASEAKLQLASVYTAETSLMSDYDAFSTCLAYAGYSGPSSNNYYAVGFAAGDATSAAIVTANGGAGCVGTTTVGQSFFNANKKVGTGLPIGSTALGWLGTTAIGANGTSFIAGAVGWISTDDVATNCTPGSGASCWTIDHNKTLQEVSKGY